MKPSEIENILRRAPQPKPPANLEQRLKAQALSAPRSALPQTSVSTRQGTWLARWWPALAPTAVSLACAAGLTIQQLEINKLRANNEPPSADPSAAQLSSQRPSVEQMQNMMAAAPSPEQDEVTRLGTLSTRLRAEVSKLEQIQAENSRLRAQLASRAAGVFTTEETQAMGAAQDRALRIECVNNLKQLGLAMRVWAMAHGDMTPPNLAAMTNEIGSGKILICPADSGRQPARDLSSLTPANCSYDYLMPSAPETEPDRIAFRCPIHGNIGLCDGSVQSAIAKEHPDWIVQRDGKYYMHVTEMPPRDATPTGVPSPSPAQ